MDGHMLPTSCDNPQECIVTARAPEPHRRRILTHKDLPGEGDVRDRFGMARFFAVSSQQALESPRSSHARLGRTAILVKQDLRFLRGKGVRRLQPGRQVRPRAF